LCLCLAAAIVSNASAASAVELLICGLRQFASASEGTHTAD
jgi:hypothetical protein